MITIITGNTGEGKTALVVKMMQEEARKRPVFSMGIRDLQVPHELVPPLKEWTELRPMPEDPQLLQPHFTFPPNALLVIDEAQNIYRPRATGSKVPDHVAALETHRHGGIDIWLITQHPTFIDTSARKLCKKHIHIQTGVLGRYKYEWNGLGDPDSKASRQIAASERYKPPKEVFSLYKSAEVHTTIKVAKPIYFWLVLILIPLLLFLAFKSYQRFQAHASPTSSTPEPESLANRSLGPTSTGQIHQTTPDYLASLKPRIDGLEHTAPIYDDVNKVVTAPLPAVCYLVKSDAGENCRCLNQQGTPYGANDQTCRDIVAHGFFNPYADTHQASASTPQPLALHSGGSVTGTVE